MSDNPYQPSVEPVHAVDAAIAGPTPGGLTPIAIICLILGVLGLMGAFLGLLAPFLMSFAAEALEKAMAEGANQEQMEMQLKVMEATQGSLFWSVALSVVNLFVAGGLIFGAISVLRNKSAGLLATMTLAAAIFVVLRCLINLVFVQLPMLTKMKEIVGDAPGQAIGQSIGLVFGLVIALAMAAFYAWCHFYLKKPIVTDYLAGR